MDYERVDGCEICAILQKDDPQMIVRSEFWQVALAPDQYYLGRSYVTARRHVGELGILTPDEWGELLEVIDEFEQGCKYGLGATHVTWAALMNNAYSANDPKPHVHWHARPRYSSPIRIAGVTFEDPQFGNHHQREETRLLRPELMDRINLSIRAGAGW